MYSLLDLCWDGNSEGALNLLLEHPEICKIGCVDMNGNTSLILACAKGMKEVALELLKYPNECKIGHVGHSSGTALIYACSKGMKEVALELLKYPNECKIDQVTEYGDTALVWACAKSMKEVALELLKYPSECKIDHVNTNGYTALVWACAKSMKEVAFELLKYPNECKIDHVNAKGNTALSYAYKNNMPEVASIIENYADVGEMLKLSQRQKIFLQKYINRKTAGEFNKLPNKEEIQERQKGLNDIEDKVKKISKDGTCLVCLGKTNNNTIFIKCKHVLHICDECMYVVDKKCPVCATTSEFITGCFII